IDGAFQCETALHRQRGIGDLAPATVSSATLTIRTVHGAGRQRQVPHVVRPDCDSERNSAAKRVRRISLVCPGPSSLIAKSYWQGSQQGIVLDPCASGCSADQLG